MVAYIIAFAIIASAAWILFRRLRDLRRTGGRSACENCPYARGCSGSCSGKK